jgi:hypothetical protein
MLDRLDLLQGELEQLVCRVAGHLFESRRETEERKGCKSAVDVCICRASILANKVIDHEVSGDIDAVGRVERTVVGSL